MIMVLSPGRLFEMWPRRRKLLLFWFRLFGQPGNQGLIAVRHEATL